MATKHRITHICHVCQQSFERKASEVAAKYCSRDCWAKRHPPARKHCVICSQEFVTYDHKQKLCSRLCYAQWQSQHHRGENAAAWKGGKSLDRLRARVSGELQRWRKAVYERDKYTCQQCGAVGNIHAHHIQAFADFPALRFEISNGLTVCISCHEAIHGKKLSGPTPYSKHCIDCEARTTGRAPRCRRCGLAHAHLMKGHKPVRECPFCHKAFQKRADIKYCSALCAQQAHQAQIEVPCDQCGKHFWRVPALVKLRKHHFCSEPCQHAYSRTGVTLSCPICTQDFTVKAYRLRKALVLTCSRQCKGKLASLTRARAIQDQLQLDL